MDTKWTNKSNECNKVRNFLIVSLVVFIITIIGINFSVDLFINGNINNILKKDEIIQRQFMINAKSVSEEMYSYTDYLNGLRNDKILGSDLHEQFQNRNVKFLFVDNKTGNIYTNYYDLLLGKNNIEEYLKQNAYVFYKADNNKKFSPLTIGSPEYIKKMTISKDFIEYYWYDKNDSNTKSFMRSYILRPVVKAWEKLIFSIACLIILIVYLVKTIPWVKKEGKENVLQQIKKYTSYTFDKIKEIFTNLTDLIENLIKDAPTDKRLKNILVTMICRTGFMIIYALMFFTGLTDVYTKGEFVTIIGMGFIFWYCVISPFLEAKKKNRFINILNYSQKLVQGDFSSEIDEYSIKNKRNGTNFKSVFLFFALRSVFMLMLIAAFGKNYTFGSFLSFCFAVWYSIIEPIRMYKSELYLKKILEGTEQMSGGNFDFTLEEQNENDLVILARNINSIKQGYQKALEEHIKNERLKTELISNVSHDLKTPLTSIVTYVDLLKRDELTEEERKDYIKILDRKANKLKVLIEDLFEVSKINSGKVQLHKEKVDVVDLIYQSLGEYTTNCQENNIDFKVNTFESSVCLQLDGKQMSRVFENLISNTCKYAMKNTRAYIDIVNENNNIKISFKNISAYEMNFDVDEIVERFKRGDESRNSKVEGSGLGLAIAKSIVELHGGKMYIEKECDMFKVFIVFRK
ncbi:sensor histidine kinase [Haloimpatiens sp. FM7330]|uniref:sensor histidine kinase n=1 Tax=Haloimpatiens sp. FM7330 TaxID=3298610 RepID=UPI00363B9D05